VKGSEGFWKDAVTSISRLARATATVAGGALLLSLRLTAASDVAADSPNGTIRLRVFTDEAARLRYEVTFKGKPVIEASPLGMSVDGQNLSEGVTLGEPDRYKTDEAYDWRGVHARAVDKSNGARITVTHQKTGAQYTVEARAADDGVAFRHVVPGGEKPRTPDEDTSFRVPAGSTVWYHDFEGHYEAIHAKKDIAAAQAGEWAAPPVTIKLPAKAGYASITESSVLGYSGMGLQADGARGFTLRLGHAHPASYPFRLRYPGDVEPLEKPATITGPITTPWRVVIIGADLNALVNADIVHNLAPKADTALFPAGLRTDWVKPGRSVWQYLDGGERTLAAMKEFSEMAGRLGFEYNLIEGHWQRWSDAELNELVDYSHERGVGVIVWMHSRDLRNRWVRRAAFQKLHQSGIAGVKVDFFDHEAKAVMDVYEAVLRDAAEFKLLVNFHGANKPAGEARTWPNELTREGVYGLEHRRTEGWGTHDATIPFTRYLAGHGDFTPVVFGERRRETSWAHQIATAAVFTSPLLVYGAHPKSLLENPAVEMIKSIPAVWDETRVLAGSEIGEVAAFARRSGRSWFVAVLNGATARKLSLDLGFLGEGTYDTLLVGDDPVQAAAVTIDRRKMDRRRPLEIDLRAGGGFIGRFGEPSPTSSR
jgi:alpha-glucosidase